MDLLDQDGLSCSGCIPGELLGDRAVGVVAGHEYRIGVCLFPVAVLDDAVALRPICGVQAGVQRCAPGRLLQGGRAYKHHIRQHHGDAAIVQGQLRAALWRTSLEPCQQHHYCRDRIRTRLPQ